jgi:hypothetical protein
MCPITKPNRIAPLAAITTFLPMEDRKKPGDAVAMCRDSNRARGASAKR